MEEGGNTRNLAEQSLTICNEQKITSQEGQSSPSFYSQRTSIELDSPLLPEVPIGESSMGDRGQFSARGEPAIHIPPPIQDTTLATCQQIVGILGQITEQQDGILRELRAMRREMRLMKCEQRRTNARVVSVAHNLDELKEHLP